MPIGKIKIKSTKKSNYGEMIEVNNYWFDETNEPLAVIYGCFSPFTGKYGHARLLQNAKEHGINKFIIVSPPKKETIDNDRNMFTLEQKVKIAQAGCEDLGYNILDARIGKWAFVLGNLNDVANEFPDNRIVLCCGPDRAEDYGKDLMPYDKERTEQLPNDQVRGKYELLVMSDRGEKNVSGTAVREMIRSNNRDAFLDATGYSEDMWDMCRHYALMNGVIDESFSESYLKEAMGATKRVGIKHLYNPGNSQELSALDFLDVLDVIEEDGGHLVNGKNVSITEKSDGAGFRMGIDEDGEFFIEQSYSGPIYDAQNILDKNAERYGKVNRLGRGWANVLNTLKADEKTQSALQKIFKEHGAFKMSGEIFIAELGYKDADGYVTFVGSRYDEKHLGKKATIILFAVNDAEGNSVSDSDSIIKYMIKNATSADVKYDDAELNLENNLEVNVSTAIKTIRANIAKIEAGLNEQGTNLADVLNSKSRTKADLALKKQVRGEIEEQQGILNSVFEKQLENYQGKWGPDYEGIVIKLKDGTMIKITSVKFKEFKAKHDDTMNNWLKSNESFRREFIDFIQE